MKFLILFTVALCAAAVAGVSKSAHNDVIDVKLISASLSGQLNSFVRVYGVECTASTNLEVIVCSLTDKISNKAKFFYLFSIAFR